MGSPPRYFRRLRRMLMHRGRTGEEAEDLVQEAFLKMHEYCQKGGQVHKPEGFLVRTVLRLAMNARRDERRDLYADQNVEELTLLIDTNPSPDEVLAAEQCLAKMREALDATSRKTRDVFFMHRLDGLSYAEIARATGVSVSRVEKQMAIALAILAEVNFQE